MWVWCYLMSACLLGSTGSKTSSNECRKCSLDWVLPVCPSIKRLLNSQNKIKRGVFIPFYRIENWEYIVSSRLHSKIQSWQLNLAYFNSKTIILFLCLFILWQLSQFFPLGHPLSHPKPRSHSPSPPCCPGPWVIHTCSLTTPFPFIPPFPPHFLTRLQQFWNKRITEFFKWLGMVWVYCFEVACQTKPKNDGYDNCSCTRFSHLKKLSCFKLLDIL